MLPATLRDLALETLEIAAADLARGGLCLVLARTEDGIADLAPPLDSEVADAGRYPEGLAGDRATGYLLRRRIARSIAGRRLGLAPGDLAVVQDARGRPELHPATTASGPGPALPHVSFAARGALGLIALADRPVGIDLEAAIAPDAIPRRLLRADEITLLDGLTPQRQQEEFLKLWCVKEAVLKAIGEGFGMPPEAVRVEWWKGAAECTIAGGNAQSGSGAVARLPAHFAFWHGSPRTQKMLYGIAVSLLSK